MRLIFLRICRIDAFFASYSLGQASFVSRAVMVCLAGLSCFPLEACALREKSIEMAVCEAKLEANRRNSHEELWTTF
jgi:hypothetical protein